MTGKELIKFIKQNKMENKDVNVIVSDGIWIRATNIINIEISDKFTDDCVFLNIDIRPVMSSSEKCHKCIIFKYPEVFKKLSCWNKKECEYRRCTSIKKLNKKDKKLFDKLNYLD